MSEHGEHRRLSPAAGWRGGRCWARWLGALALAGGGGWSLAAAQTPAAVPAVTAFVDVAVIPMDRERVLTGQTVVVTGDRISALGPVAQVPVPAGATRVDGRGKFLIPGLADMHVHIVDPDLWRLPAGAELTDSKTTTDFLSAFVANGVTTVRDMHSARRNAGQEWRFELRRLIAAGQLLGPRIYTAGDPDFSSAEAAARTVAELKADGHAFVKQYGYERPVYDSIEAVAKRVGLRVAGHVPDEPGLGVEQVLADRWASIEHMTGYFVHLAGGNVQTALRLFKQGYQPDSAKLRHIAEATARAGVWNCLTLLNRTARMTANAGESGDTVVLQRQLGFYHQLVRALHAAGAGLLSGTDAAVRGQGRVPGSSLPAELALYVAVGLTPYQALETSTRNAAAFLGTLDSTGTIAVGKRADLVLLSGNPLTDIKHVARPAGVAVGGRWLSRAELDARLAESSYPEVRDGRPSWHP